MFQMFVWQSIHPAVGVGMFMQQYVCPVADFGNVWTVASLPSDRFRSTSYSLSIISSIVGPEVSGSSEVVPPLMTILLMEVVTVSTYVRPVALSFTIQPELTLEIPWAITIPMDRVPMGTSWSNSTQVLVYVSRPSASQSCMVGWEALSVPMLSLVVRVWVEKVFPMNGMETPYVSSATTGMTSLSVSQSRLAVASLWQWSPAGMGATPFPTLWTVGIYPGIEALVWGLSGEHWWGKG